MSAIPTKPNRTGCIIGIGAIVLLLCCGVLVVGGIGAYVFLNTGAPMPTPQISIGQPIPKSIVPIPSTAPTSKSETYAGKGAPFSVKYPNDWTVEDQESDSHVVVFISPDQSASASVTYGAAGALTASQAADRLVGNVLVDAQVINKKNNSDGSVTVEVEHTNEDLGGRVRGYMRVIIAGNQFYVVQFNALVDDFDTYKQNGNAIVNSLTVRP